MIATEVINGTTPERGGFEGLVPLMKEYIRDHADLLMEQREKLQQYVQFVADRADGYPHTTARWMRKVIASHEEYQGDSVVSERITHDLIRECVERSLRSDEQTREE